MTVSISVEQDVLVVAFDGGVTQSDIADVTRTLEESVVASRPRLVLAKIGKDVGRPDPVAKKAMRESRDILRTRCSEIHVVIERGGILGSVGVFLANAARFMVSGRPKLSFYRDEREARQALNLPVA